MQHLHLSPRERSAHTADYRSLYHAPLIDHALHALATPRSLPLMASLYGILCLRYLALLGALS